jgi:hypothetical protein
MGEEITQNFQSSYGQLNIIKPGSQSQRYMQLLAFSMLKTKTICGIALVRRNPPQRSSSPSLSGSCENTITSIFSLTLHVVVGKKIGNLQIDLLGFQTLVLKAGA